MWKIYHLCVNDLQLPVLQMQFLYLFQRRIYNLGGVYDSLTECER